MANAFYVTTKAFCKRTWLGALLAVATLVFGPWLFSSGLRIQGANLTHVKHDLIIAHFFYLGFSWAFFLAVCFQGLQKTKKIAIGLPVSSTSIASWLMFATVGMIVVLQIMTNGAYRLLFFDGYWLSTYWPLMGPLLFISMMVLVGHAIFWSMHAPGFIKLFCWIGLISMLLWWFISCYFPGGFHEDLVPWVRVTLSEYITMLLVCVAAWYQGARAYGKFRNGTAVPSKKWEQFQMWWKNWQTGAISENQAFASSTESSLASLHWRDSCRRAVIVTGISFGIVILAVNLALKNTFGMSPIRQAEGFLTIAMVFVYVASVIVALLLGEGTCSLGRKEMKPFLAIAPLSDRDLSATLFWNMQKTFVSSFLLIQLGLLLSFTIVALMHGPGILITLLHLEFWKIGILKYFILPISSFWIISANMISVYWTGRTWFYYTILGVLFGCFGLFMGVSALFEQVFRNNIVFMFFLIGFFLSMSLLILGGTAIAYFVTCRKKLMNISTALIVFLLWLTGATLGFYLNYEHPQTLQNVAELFLLFFFISIFSLAVTPFATIPLAVSWNRHR